MTLDEFAQAHEATMGHEAAHGLHVPHTSSCNDIMFTVRLTSGGRVSVIDVVPIPLNYSNDDQQHMRLQDNQ
jgi:hypothetical protein